MKKFIYPLFILLVLSSGLVKAQSKTKASSPFAYIPDNSEDRYNQRITQKTIPVGQNEFVILSRRSESEYAVEKINTDLKKAWSATLPVSTSETIDAFFINGEAAIVITHRNNGQGSQQLYGHRISLHNGAKQEPVLLVEAPSKARRASITASADGSKILAYRYQTDGNQQLRSISGTMYDGNLASIKNISYNLTDLPAILSADVQLSNTGDQYINLISDNMRRLTVKQYPLNGTEVKVMSVLVGGVFEGRKVYIMDSKFSLMPDGQLYGAVLTSDEDSGQYYSLKAVKFNFEAEDMVFAEEFKFTPTYLASINQLDKYSATKPDRLEDIYLSDLVLTPEQKLVVMAEKKYTEGGENSPYYAREIHLFAYDEFMDNAWSSVLMKHQKAPADEAFSGISYKAKLFGNNLHLLTLEELNGKYDLYLRRINTSTGTADAPKAIGLNVANDKSIAYVKDFTAWLTDRNIITVVRPTKKANSLQLSRILLK
ncbi:hypothetical protein [Pontibacter vulgaris]|uniref:hypothetical protein n=1 Tax=Pontibacter vulgaris TaxID=2905679 RepID=UPI001FA79A89|nr:hypothetical protein [Pontibacter vulgaris]